MENLNISGYKILINSLGCAKDRVSYEEALGEFLTKKSSGLCDNCIRRKETNVLRVLDCKNEECRKVIEKAPKVTNHLCDECAKDYADLKRILSRMNVKFKEKGDLVRGLDYYTNTVFEVVHSALGAQDAIAAGGRYDNLTKQMGGPDVGATGYALGVERLLLAVDRNEIRFFLPEILVVPVDEVSRQDAFDIANRLRSRDIACEMNLSGRSLKAQMRKANKEGRKYIIMIGEEERKGNTLLLKNMETGEQESLTYEEMLDKLEREREEI